MNRASRFFKTKTNLIWQFIYQAVTLILGLILPRIVVDAYGSDVNGLTATVKNVVLLVTLAKAGISTAVTYSLYKPVNEKNRVAIATVLASVKRTFNKVGIVTAIIGIIASILLAKISTSTIVPSYIFAACVLMCLHTVIDISFTATYNVFFSATQDRYVISVGLLIASVITYGLEILIAVLQGPFIMLYACSIIGCVVKIAFFKAIFSNKYEEYKLQPGEKADDIKVGLSGIGYATANEIAHSAVAALQTVIISVVCGFAQASVFSIYAMIVNALSLISQVFYSSFSPSFGSLVAEGNIDRINRAFRIFQFSYMALNTFLYMCSAYLIIPFVRIYTINMTDINYINPILAYEYILYGMFYAFRVPYNIVVSTNGLFKSSGMQTSITAVFAILISVLFSFVNYTYVIIGAIVFYITNTVYQHFMLRNSIKGFDNSHFKNHLLISFSGVTIMTISYLLTPTSFYPASMAEWILYAVITAAISAVLLLVLMMLCDRKCLKESYVFYQSKLDRKG